MTNVGIPAGVLHGMVLVVLAGLWYLTVLRVPARHRAGWYHSSFRSVLVTCTLPILISAFLVYLALMDSPFITSRSGRQFLTLTILLWLLCLGISLQKYLTQPGGLSKTRSKSYPERLDIEYAQDRVKLFLLLLSGVTFWILYNIGMGLFSGHAVLILSAGMMLAVWTVFVVPSFWVLLRAMRHRGPVVTFDDQGIMDRRLLPNHVIWQDVGRIRLGYRGTYYKLRIALRHSAAAQPYVGRPYYPRKLFNMLVGLGDWNIGLGLLDVRRAEALEIALHYQARSRRSHPVA